MGPTFTGHRSNGKSIFKIWKLFQRTYMSDVSYRFLILWNSIRFLFAFRCNQEKPSNDFVMLACRHQHCLECFRNYLKFALADYERPKAIPCPSRCIQMINDEHIFQLIHDDENLAKSYRKYLINCFVQSNPLLQWCPGRDCSTIVKMKNYNRFNSFLIHCDNCETEFCFNCTQPWHEPLQCSVLKKWNQKNVDESMNAQWLTASKK